MSNVKNEQYIQSIENNLPQDLKSIPAFTNVATNNSKLPVSPHTLKPFKVYESDVASFETALKNVADSKSDAIGIRADQSNSVVVFDFDHVLNSQGEFTSQKSKDFFQQLPNTYVELSLSGTGLHAICFMNPDEKKIFEKSYGTKKIKISFDDDGSDIEIFVNTQSTRLTGNLFSNQTRAIAPISFDTLDALISTYKPKKLNTTQFSKNQRYIGLDITNTRLAKKLIEDPKFAACWNGDASYFSGDESRSDMSLIKNLCFICEGNYNEIDSLFRRSPAFQSVLERKKNYTEDYIRRTIETAVNSYSPNYFITKESDSTMPPELFIPIESANQTLGSCVDDVPEDLASFKIPPGYLVSDSGILYVKKQKFAMRSLCFISKIYYEFDSVDGRKTFYQMTARIDHRWNRFEIPAKLIKDARTVVATLSDCGVEIDSNGARYAVSFFNDFNSINEDSIPHVHRFSKTGWNNDKFIIPREDFDFEVNAGTSTSYVYTKGSRDESLNLIIESRKRNDIRAMIDSALSATIIGKINCNNFVVNFWGRSGFGKTASFYLVNSLFADPSFIIDFNATPNALESQFAERNDLPSFVNEFQLASSKIKAESAGDIIHRFESGETRKRLNEKSKSRPIKRFTSVMLMNAEQPALNPNVEGGKIRRALEIHIDKPIPPALCKRFYSESKKNFGHIGLEFIQLFESGTITFDFARSKRDEFQTLIKELNPDAIDSHLDYISVITLVDFLFQIHFEGVDEKTATNSALEFAEFLTQFAKSKSDLSDAERAKSYIIDWRHIHEMKFLSTSTDNVKFIRDVYGYYLQNSNIPLVNPSVLRNALLDGGFSPNKIFAEWHDEGVISYDESSKAYSQPFICNDGKRRRLTKLDFLNVDDQNPSNGVNLTSSNEGDSIPSGDSNSNDGYSQDEDPFPKS